MKAVIYTLTAVLCMAIILISPIASAQDGSDGEEGSDDACIFTTFCIVMLFVLFLIYVAAKWKSDASQEAKARWQSRMRTYQQGDRYPTPHKIYPPPPGTALQPKPLPQKKDVRCDSCSSKNLRFFEKGYVKCNDCRHVFYISEGYRTRRR